MNPSRLVDSVIAVAANRGRGVRRGFVLLMSLVLIALAGIMLTSLARHRLTLAVEANLAKYSLQQRWGTFFACRAMLNDPEQIIQRNLHTGLSASRQLPIVSGFQLGDVTFEIVLDDENRKLNVNRLYATTDTRKMLDVLHQFATQGEQIDLRPLEGTSLGVRAFDSWGHVLRLGSKVAPHEVYDQVAPLSQKVTCWGNAKVNLQRCDSDVLYQIGALAVGPITANQLVALHDDEPSLKTDQLLSRLEISRRKRAILQGWLSDDSTCHSLWIISGNRQSSCDFYVHEATGSDSAVVRQFRW
jgi:hypothetical protein